MGIVAVVLLGCAVALLVAAEWPRLGAKVGAEARAGRSRRKRKERLTVIEGQQADEDFAASVERDLANLPVLGEPEDRTRR